MPFRGHRGYTGAREDVRQVINAEIRARRVFDAVVDFDGALRDPYDPRRFRSEYDSGDHLHPSDRGYARMATASSCIMPAPIGVAMKTQRDGIDPEAKPSGTGCAECLAAGTWWFHLRRCAQCGHIGCCDSSPNQHATKHHHATGHPVIASFEPGERWFWNYRTEQVFAGPELAAQFAS